MVCGDPQVRCIVRLVPALRARFARALPFDLGVSGDQGSGYVGSGYGGLGDWILRHWGIGGSGDRRIMVRGIGLLGTGGSETARPGRGILH